METKQLLEKVRSEITRRALPQGGWSSAESRQASVETTCLSLMALRQIGRASDLGRNFLLHIQNADGSWPAFRGDDAEGCWTTSLAVITLLGHNDSSAQRGIQWLKDHQRQSGRWFTPSQSWHQRNLISNAGTAYAVMALKACEE